MSHYNITGMGQIMPGQFQSFSETWWNNDLFFLHFSWNASSYMEQMSDDQVFFIIQFFGLGARKQDVIQSVHSQEQGKGDSEKLFSLPNTKNLVPATYFKNFMQYRFDHWGTFPSLSSIFF